MAYEVPLPAPRTLPEGVLLHREHPADLEVVLQVPNAERSDFETYIIDMEDPAHRAWLDGLKNSRMLKDMLAWAKHVAYMPHTGHYQEMPDLDKPNQMMMLFNQARQQASRERSIERMFIMRKRRVPPVSRLRRALSGGRVRP